MTKSNRQEPEPDAPASSPRWRQAEMNTRKSLCDVRGQQVFTPKGVRQHSPGSRQAYPGNQGGHTVNYPERVVQGESKGLCNPCGVRRRMETSSPGCAAATLGYVVEPPSGY